MKYFTMTVIKTAKMAANASLFYSPIFFSPRISPISAIKPRGENCATESARSRYVLKLIRSTARERNDRRIFLARWREISRGASARKVEENVQRGEKMVTKFSPRETKRHGKPHRRVVLPLMEHVKATNNNGRFPA